jgi:hypothetical protein
MENDKKDVEIVDNLISISESQKNRVLQFDTAQDELLGFLRSQIARVIAKNDMETLIDEQLTARINPPQNDNDENAPEPMSTGYLIKLKELLLKDKSEGSMSILNVLKETQKTIINNNIPASPLGNTPKEDLPFTKEDVNDLKGLMDVLKLAKDLKQSELSLDELENKTK